MKILLPVDGSELSLHEVRFALRLVTEGLQASFLLVNVQEPASLYEMVRAPDPEVLANVKRGAGEDALQPALSLLGAAGISCETEVAEGDPANAIVDLIEEYGCDLVVMGTRGTGPLRSAWQASVAQRLVHESPVPVLLVKLPDETGQQADAQTETESDTE